jgi:6-phosphofructokinase 1
MIQVQGTAPLHLFVSQISVELLGGASLNCGDMKTTKQTSLETVAIVVGGGPAPGINGVISAATIEAINRGRRVIGIYDGFKWLAKADTSQTVELKIEDVSRIHFQGGSILRTSRENPSKDPKKLANVVAALQKLKVRYLITIGGDDTALSSSRVAEATRGAISVAHVPKTIDNDLPLPRIQSTFGFHTARHVGTQLVSNLMEDARTTGRWYLVVTMGRNAGFLAMGMGKAAGATLTIIPEEFQSPEITLGDICDIIEGAIYKRLIHHRKDGVAVIAEGVALKLSKKELMRMEQEKLAEIEFDSFGNPRLSEVNLGKAIKDELERRLAEREISVSLVETNIGYVLRSAPPIPFDLEYTRDLGYAAIKFLLEGGSGAMVTVQGGKLVPMPFSEIMGANGKTKIRTVDVTTESYEVARKYMIRLGAEDLSDTAQLKKLAAAAKMTPAEFKKRFGHLK